MPLPFLLQSQLHITHRIIWKHQYVHPVCKIMPVEMLKACKLQIHINSNVNNAIAVHYMLFITVTVHTDNFSILRTGLSFLCYYCLSLMPILIALQIHPFLFKMVEIVEGVGLGYVLWLTVIYHFLVALLLLFSLPILTCLFPLSLITLLSLFFLLAKLGLRKQHGL